MTPIKQTPLDNNMTAPPERGPNRAARRKQLAFFKASKKFNAIELNYLKSAIKGLN